MEEGQFLKHLVLRDFTLNLDKKKLAQQLVEDLLCEPPDPTLVARVLIQASAVWHDLGATEMSLALVQRAKAHLKTGDLAEKAWVRHQEARLYLKMGELDQASGAVDEAIRLALDAGVKQLGLFHHNQDRTDEAVDAFVRHARKKAQSSSLSCFGVQQGMEVKV